MSKTSQEKIPFTPERIRNITPPEKGRRYVYDSKQDGLCIQITPAGTRTFKYYRWVKNHGPVKITIGKFPGVSLNDARAKAVALAGEISMKGKSVIEKLQLESNEQTFEQLFESWFKDQQAAEKRDLANVRSRYRNHIKPTIGNKRPSALTAKHLQSWFLRLPRRKKIQGDGTISNSTANRCMEIVSSVFEKKSTTNPASNIEHFPEESRERYLSGDELGRLFGALTLQETPTTIKDIVPLALTTGARKMNILSMRWDEVDLDNGLWVIPGRKSKNKKSMGIPLIPEAIDILEQRKKTAKSVFVFPSKGKRGHMVDIRRAWGTLLKQAKITDFTFHDLRRTLGSWQAHAGSSDLLIGKSLGHASTQSTRVYARIRDTNPIKESMSNGFAAMIDASKKKKIVEIK